MLPSPPDYLFTTALRVLCLLLIIHLILPAPVATGPQNYIECGGPPWPWTLHYTTTRLSLRCDCSRGPSSSITKSPLSAHCVPFQL
ncbi:hypothetical protein K438DRAFT_1888293 [Mycena galopus ATCC 62051]|nr:hypothetical protein K438DRAFT_1888293 [Mycena galopus ATCC 62051]